MAADPTETIPAASGALVRLDLDAVLFDAGGVLVLPDPTAIRTRLGPLGASPDDECCHRAHYAGMREVDRLGSADWLAVDRLLARLLGVPDEHVEAAVAELERVYLQDRWIPVTGSAEALQRIAAGGWTLGVISNASGTMERMLLDHRICGVDDGAGSSADPLARVAVVVDSHVVGVEKPDPRIFAIALEAVGLPAERCAYVGDTVHFDVNGSRNAGLHPIHLDPYGSCPGDDHDHIVELGDLLGP